MDIITLTLAKKYVDKVLNGAGALQGKSAYEVAVDNGYVGTAKEWLEGLKGLPGTTPTIDPETLHWLINGVDTGVSAQVSDYTLLNNKPVINGVELTGKEDISLDVLGVEFMSDEEIDSLFN